VAQKRFGLGTPAHGGSAGGGRAWTAAEVKLLGTNTDAEAVAKIGRTAEAVRLQRVGPADHVIDV
jgi:hypothetical protein